MVGLWQERKLDSSDLQPQAPSSCPHLLTPATQPSLAYRTHLSAILQLLCDPHSLSNVEVTAKLDKCRVQQTTGPRQLIQLQTNNNKQQQQQQQQR